MMRALPIGFTLLLAIFFAAEAAGQEKVRLRGQVVCSACWFEAADRKKHPYGTAADVQCAVECSEKGLPQALAVEDENGFTLYTLEKGKLDTKGKDFLSFVPNHVEIAGDLRVEKEKRFLKVNSITPLGTAAPKPTPAPSEANLTLKDLTGAEQSLAALRGRVVVVNFWATWCEPCKKEMPDLAAVQNDYAPLGVQVIGAAGDEVADGAKVLKFTREFKLNFPVWLGASTADMERFGVGSVLPATVIVDREGKIVWRHVGIIKPAELREQLDNLLKPKIADAAKTAKAASSKAKNASLVPA
jgi:thiol-disulfide isomerase/thioredoxin